jgi:hypothetical protein
MKLSAGTGLDIGDEIVCLGNSAAGSVITHLEGKVLGVGGDTIEVDAEVVGGNSGCPVLHVSSGTVVGVVTRAEPGELTWKTQGTRFAEARRFCLKVEGAKWKQIGWKTFADDARRIQSCLTQRAQLHALVADLGDGSLNATAYDDASVAIRAAVRAFITAASNTSLARNEFLKAQAAFLRQVAFEVEKGPDNDLAELQKRGQELAGYHKELLKNDAAARKSLAAELKTFEQATIAVAGAAVAPPASARKPKQKAPSP